MKKITDFIKKNYIWIIMFSFFVLFFTKIYPLIIYDADDWTYVAQPRSMIPIYGAWNPSKILPETLMPLCGSISAYLLNIFINDYVSSFMIISSILISFLITLYAHSFYDLISKKFKLENSKSTIITILFLLFHLVIFYRLSENNEYLFYAHNVNCYYNYLIPNLICFILVFKMMASNIDDYSFPKKLTLKSGVILLIFLLAIFSNLYCNISLIVYIGSVLLLNIIKSIKKKVKIREVFKKNLEKRQRYF